jgi:hypothetical protein
MVLRFRRQRRTVHAVSAAFVGGESAFLSHHIIHPADVDRRSSPANSCAVERAISAVDPEFVA